MEDEEKIRNAIKNYRWGAVSNLICCDVVTAVSYCLFLMLSHGEKTVVVNGLLPLSVLWLAPRQKQKGATGITLFGTPFGTCSAQL